jgi:hypothetical protein
VKKLMLSLAILCLIAALGYAYWKFFIPTHRVDIHSELVMLGDLDDDHRWTDVDIRKAESFQHTPFAVQTPLVWRLDLNQNGLIEGEDLSILRALVTSSGDAYLAEESVRSTGATFPRPRELYRYRSFDEYLSRPYWNLPYPLSKDSVLDWLQTLKPASGLSTYEEGLRAAVFDEAVRFDQAWRKREPQLMPIERDYARQKLATVKSLYVSGNPYELLLALMDLVEDAETLTVLNQPEFPLKLLAFRDHLREIPKSSTYERFKEGKLGWNAVMNLVAGYLHSDLGQTYNFETLAPPRNLTQLDNYLQRAEWQYYKSTVRESDFRAIVNYAQHDRRYLRAVSRTSRKLQDPNVVNHNLPMVLLFREALRIKGNDKKSAVGLLDEAIRIPYGWIKSIPRDSLPSSLALDNFLLPGNKEDGADKSRHWNVFGGICIYKSPQEALDLALKREMKDLRDELYSEPAMREFFRDMIANLNGMYHVMTVNPKLVYGNE